MPSFARDIPPEAFQRLEDLPDARSIAFTPGGGWVILHAHSAVYARDIPPESFQRLGEIGAHGHLLKSIAFAPGGGWVIVS